jgi:hypothetical protein
MLLVESRSADTFKPIRVDGILAAAGPGSPERAPGLARLQLVLGMIVVSGVTGVRRIQFLLRKSRFAYAR